MRRSIVVSLTLVTLWLGGLARPAAAQLLIWSVPKQDGAWVRFEGTYRQTRARPNNNAGDEILEWRNELTISSVGAEKAQFEGRSTPCRWVEFKTITKTPDVEQQAGPGGTYVYKVLLPEHRVTGKIADDDGVPVTFLPIIKGYRRVSGREPEPVAEQALAVYPVIAPLTYYANLKETEKSADLAVPFSPKPLKTSVWKGNRVLLESTIRSTNSASLWRTDEVPFGVAKFQVSITREEKDPDAAADAFRRTSLVEIEMTAVATGADAKSELPDSR